LTWALRGGGSLCGSSVKGTWREGPPCWGPCRICRKMLWRRASPSIGALFAARGTWRRTRLPGTLRDGEGGSVDEASLSLKRLHGGGLGGGAPSLGTLEVEVEEKGLWRGRHFRCWHHSCIKGRSNDYAGQQRFCPMRKNVSDVFLDAEFKCFQNFSILFYTRVVNKTNISFMNEEMALLNKGLKYSLHHKDKHWLSNLALEAEAALTPLPPPEQEHIRHQVVHNLRKLYKHHNNTPSPKTPRNEIKILTKLRRNFPTRKPCSLKQTKATVW